MTSAAHIPEMGKKVLNGNHYDLLCERMSQVESLLVVLDSATDEENNGSPPVSKHIKQAFWAIHTLMEQAQEARALMVGEI